MKLLNKWFPSGQPCIVAGDPVHKSFDIVEAVAHTHQDAWQFVADFRYAFRRFSFVTKDKVDFQRNLCKLDKVAAEYRSERARSSARQRGGKGRTNKWGALKSRRAQPATSQSGEEFNAKEKKWISGFLATASKRPMAKQLRSKLKNYSKRPILYNGKRLPGGVAHRMLNRGVKRAPNKTGVPVE